MLGDPEHRARIWLKPGSFSGSKKDGLSKKKQKKTCLWRENRSAFASRLRHNELFSFFFQVSRRKYAILLAIPLFQCKLAQRAAGK